MKREIIIEIERITIISNNPPKTSDKEKQENEIIEVEAKEIKKENIGLLPPEKEEQK